MTERKSTPEVISDEALDDVNGGIALLLPAVQAARESAARAGDGSVKPGDGSVKPIAVNTGGNGI